MKRTVTLVLAVSLMSGAAAVAQPGGQGQGAQQPPSCGQPDQPACDEQGDKKGKGQGDKKKGGAPDGQQGPPPGGQAGPPPGGQAGPPPGGQAGPPPGGQQGQTQDWRRQDNKKKDQLPGGQQGLPPGGQAGPPPAGQAGPPPVGQAGPPPSGGQQGQTQDWRRQDNKKKDQPPGGQQGQPPGGQAGPPPVGPFVPKPGGQAGPPPGGQPPGGPFVPQPGGQAGPPSGGQFGLPPGGARWSRGQRVPQQYRQDQFAIQDWQRNNLPPPPRGYRWMCYERGNCFLVQSNTGYISRTLRRDDRENNWRRRYSRVYTYNDDLYYRECRGRSDPAGILIGGLIGGLLGRSIGDDRAGATFAGIIIGGAFGGALTRDLDCDDRSYAYHSYYEAFNGGRPGRVYRWRNPHNNHRGDFVVRSYYYDNDGFRCANYRHTIWLNRQRRADGRACRQPDGAWAFLN